jgi:hypothetical protein
MWTLITKDTAYEMDGAECVSSSLLEIKPDGSKILKTPKGNFVYNDNAPTPKMKEKPKGVLLRVPFWKQTDNYRDPNRTCFSSSMAMMVEYYLPDELPNDDTYVKTVFSIGDTTDPNVQLEALKRHGITGLYSQEMGFGYLDSSLSTGNPIGLGILHRGPLSAPTGGHWIVCTGVSADGSKYRFNDPYGSVLNGYTGPVDEGKEVWYSKEVLQARWTAEGPNSGWGMLCRVKK